MAESLDIAGRTGFSPSPCNQALSVKLALWDKCFV